MTTVVDGDKVIMKSYLVDDETQEITLIDQYAIKKDLSQKAEIEPTDLPTDNVSNIDDYIMNIVTEIIGMLYSYVAVLLPLLLRSPEQKPWNIAASNDSPGSYRNEIVP